MSVVVTVVDGGVTLERCLTALTRQADAPALEIVVPWDDTLPGMPGLAARFPSVHFLAMGPVATRRRSSGPAGQHELFDRRRSAGLGVVTGELVAIVEDRGVPRPTWAAALARLHAELPHAVIGGAVENGRPTLLNRAVYACDFGRYQLPFAAGPRDYVTDVNICYKRRAIEATRELWRERYHETTVHWALQRVGETLYISPEPVVEQMRDGLSLRRVLGERFGWGRLFAYTRARETAMGKRLVLAALSPVLPFLLLFRLLRHQMTRSLPLAPFLAASPVILLLLAGWSAGEAVGYVTGEA